MKFHWKFSKSFSSRSVTSTRLGVLIQFISHEVLMSFGLWCPKINEFYLEKCCKYCVPSNNFTQNPGESPSPFDVKMKALWHSTSQCDSNMLIFYLNPIHTFLPSKYSQRPRLALQIMSKRKDSNRCRFGAFQKIKVYFELRARFHLFSEWRLSGKSDLIINGCLKVCNQIKKLEPTISPLVTVKRTKFSYLRALGFQLSWE